MIKKQYSRRSGLATPDSINGRGGFDPLESWQRLDPVRRYSPPQCTGVKIRIQAGDPRRDRINTSFVERANLSVRHFNKRFARLGLGWSRKLENHKHAISLFIAAYNFCKVHSTLGCTPAVGLKLTTETWTIERLIDEITK